jgi:DNA-binding transcriptional LysR family regulator
MINVTLKQLRSFVAIAREAGFTRAAARLNVSQSALTLQIRALEAAIGLRLFDRSSRSVELTAAGRDFQPLAERMLEELDGALDNLQVLARRERGSVTLVAGAAVIQLAVTPALAELSRTHPGVSMRILENVGEEVARGVATGYADFAIANFISPTETIASSLLLKDAIGMLCHAQHPLARRGNLSWKDLKPYSLATTLSQGKVLRDMIDRNAPILSSLPKPRFETSSISALMSIVEHDLGIALLPRLVAIPAAANRKLVFRPIQAPTMFRELCFITSRRRSLTPAANLVARAVLKQLDTAIQARRVGAAIVTSNLSAFLRKLEVDVAPRAA